jgi:hypothetical protein
MSMRFSQEYGMDYEEPFVHVTNMTTICIIIVVLSVRPWNITQIDVKNTFLNGDLQEKKFQSLRKN